MHSFLMADGPYMVYVSLNFITQIPIIFLLQVHMKNYECSMIEHNLHKSNCYLPEYLIFIRLHYDLVSDVILSDVQWG